MNGQPENFNKGFYASPKASFVMGALAGVALMSITGFILAFTVFNGSGAERTATTNTSGTVAGEQAPAPSDNPTPSQPTDTNPSQPVNITLRDDDHIRGDKNASITLVEYSDFQCPFCQKFAPTTKQMLDTYKGKVKLVYRHFPLSFHPFAQKAAEASECVAELGGNDKFWEYHDLVFENQDQLSLENLKTWAKDVGVNSSKFDSCLDDGKYEKKVQDDLAQGTQYGVNGTPATFVNGQLVSGALPFETFKQIIDGLL